MICESCRKGADISADVLHRTCLGETHCACQHRTHRWVWHKTPAPQALGVAGIDSSEAVGNIGGD